MGRSRTILLGHHPAAPEVQAVLDGSFDATWFDNANRWNVSAGTAHVYLDYDPHFDGYFDNCISDEERAVVVATLGGRPGLALHVQISTNTPGSSELADDVARIILGRWAGIVDAV